MSTTSLVLREYNGVEIPHRVADRYIHATAMCKANNKLWADYWRLKSTQEFAAELSATMGIPIVELAQSREGRPDLGGGTWVHPLIAINLAQWCSARFAVQVSIWMEELLTTGSVHLAAEPARVEDRQPLPPHVGVSTAERAAALFERLGGIEERERLALRDFVYQAISRSSGELVRFVQVTQRVVELGYPRLARGEDSSLGRRVATAFRKATAQTPGKHDQRVDGATRLVNDYERTDRNLAIIDEVIHTWHRERNVERRTEHLDEQRFLFNGYGTDEQPN